MAIRGLTEEIIKLAGGGNFVLMELFKDGPKPVYDHAGELLTFKDGAQADAAAYRFTQDRGRKVQPRRVVDERWREREKLRMTDGTYLPLPWGKEPWWQVGMKDIHNDHYPHVSLGKAALISYTENEDKGSADIQTPVKPGRYLEQHFPMLSPYVIRDLCSVFSSKFEDNKLLFGETEEEFEEVFTTGPTSCMSKKADQYATKGLHPVRIYAAGDLKVAYMMRQGKIAARTIIWPDKKLHNNIYGDSGRLKVLLDKEGFKQGSMAGARLLKRTVPGKGGLTQYVVPHVDNTKTVVVKGDHLVVSNDVEIGLTVPGGAGLSELTGLKCARCAAEDMPQRLTVTVATAVNKGESWCKKCHSKHAITCCYSGTIVPRDQTTELKEGRIANFMLVHTFICAGTGIRWTNNHLVTMPNDVKWSHEYYRSQGAGNCRCGPVTKEQAKGCAKGNGCVRQHLQAVPAQTAATTVTMRYR